MSTTMRAKALELQHLTDAADEEGQAVTIILSNRRIYRIEVTPLLEAEQAKEAIDESV